MLAHSSPWGGATHIQGGCRLLRAACPSHIRTCVSTMIQSLAKYTMQVKLHGLIQGLTMRMPRGGGVWFGEITGFSSTSALSSVSEPLYV